VPAIWKTIAMTVIGILLGGAPAYISLAIDQHAAVTRNDVDTEIQKGTAPIVQSISDMRSDVQELKDEVHELRRGK
jgi:hypothetical protein